MATIQQIQTNLLTATLNGNWTLLNSTLNSIVPIQLTSISRDSILTSFARIIDRDNPNSTSDNAAITNATKNFLATLGSRVDATTYGYAMEQFALKKNYAALDAVTDMVSTMGGTTPSSIPRATFNKVLIQLTDNDSATSTADNAAITNNVRDFLGKFDGRIDASAYAYAMEQFAQKGNFAALDAVTDTLSTMGGTTLSAVSRATFNTVLTVLVDSDDPRTAADNATIANNVRDFLGKFDGRIDAQSYAYAMEQFAQKGNFAALDAVTDILSTLGGTTPFSVPRASFNAVLNTLVTSDDPRSTADNATIANNVRDFLGKFDDRIDAQTYAYAMEQFAQKGNFAALDAVTDALSTLGGTTQSSVPRATFNTVLTVLVNSDDPRTTADNATIAAEISDFMDKFGSRIDLVTVDYAVEKLAQTGNFDAIDGMLDTLSVSQTAQLLYGDNGMDSFAILQNHGATLGSTGNDTITGTSGADTIYGLNGNDTIRGGAGADNIYGGAGNDTLYGDAGYDVLYGGLGKDILQGGAGNDRLVGGEGADTLTGGAGADTFVFTPHDLGTGVDTIKDFKTAENDRIDITDLLDQHNANDPIADFVRLTTSGGNTVVQVDTDGKGGDAGFASVAIIEGGTTMTLDQLISNGNLII